MDRDYSISVRRATPADAEAIAKLSREVFVATFVDDFKIPYHPDDLEAFLEQRHGPASQLDKITDPAIGFWIGEVDGALAGYASTGPMSLPHPDVRPRDRELYRLYVRRAFHGKGIAAALMAEAETGIDWIGVWSANIRAQRFYARYGFEKAGEYDYPVGRTIDREFILRRSLRA